VFYEKSERDLIFFTAGLPYRHAFSTRKGGVSTLPHLRSLNLGENRGDDPSNVERNYDIFLGAVGTDRSSLVLARQIHSAKVRYVTADERGRMLDGCDGFVTDVEGVALGIKTADCLPVLLADESAHVIGALHAGWRGSASGIAAEGVRMMIKRGARPERIKAAIGAGIRPCCYEVGDDFKEQIAEQAGERAANECVIVGEDGKYRADLYKLNLMFAAGAPATSPNCFSLTDTVRERAAPCARS